MLGQTNPVPTVTSANPSQAVAGATVSITLTGTGFVSGTAILVNGTAVPATYQSATKMIAQVTAPAGSTSNLAVTGQNPAPGGGTSATAYQLGAASMQLTATDPDGTNTGTARLGVPVNFSTVCNDTASSVRGWSLQGAGHLSVSGYVATYTPPSTMPASSSVTVTAYLSNVPAVTTSYTFTLVNPVPSVSSATPTQLLTGGTQTVTLTGAGFVSGTTVLLNGTALPTTYVSYTQATVQVPVAANATGTLILQLQNPGSGGPAVSYSLPIAVDSIALAPTTQTGPVVALGGSLTMGATVSGSVSTAVTWGVTGDGTISSTGTYVAPAALSTGSAVITAALTSNPAVTASYPLTLVNPLPVLTSASPSQAVAGATASITLTGTGFVSGTTILVNGAAVPTTYQSATSVVAQITAPAGAASNLAVTAQNPAPGGGTSATAYQLGTASMQLTATDPDGTNTGTARLGVPVSFSTVCNDTANTVRGWSLQGAGTLSVSGYVATYTPPSTMPASSSVTVTAYLSNVPAVTTSYTFTLVNPVPSVSSATPTQLLTGGTQTVTLTGAGFVSGTTVLLNGTALPTTYVSYTQATVQVPVAANATGTLILQLQNPGSGGPAVSYSLPIAVDSIALAPTTQTGPVVALGGSLTMGATVSGSVSTAVTWGVTGDGTISSTGTYVAPAALSTGSAVITAALTSNPAVTASYPLTFLDPPPVLNTANPTQALAGSATSITLTGAGFVPATVILVNGAAVPATYQSATTIIAQITTPAGATGNLAIQAQNPAPGGGTSSTLQLSVASLQLTATDPDGTNTGTARLSVPLSFSTVNTDTAHQAQSWTLQGAGSLSYSGTNNVNATYTPPTTMPANPTVTITTYLSALPALTTSYTFTLVNPVPTISSASPSQAVAGATVPITLTGTEFLSGTVILVNGVAVPATYQSATTMIAQITAPAGSTSNLAVTAKNPTPGGGTSATAYQLGTANMQLTATDPDGTNTGTARLGVPVNFSTVCNDTAHTVRGWSLQGAGHLSVSGYVATYTPPSTMPASSSVTVTAYLSSVPAVTTSYTFTLVNPVPTVSSVTPTQLLSGGSQTLTLTGSEFMPGTTVTLNGTSYPIVYVDYNDATAQVTVAPNAAGTLTLQIQNPAPGGGSSTFTESVIPNSISLSATNSDGSSNAGTAILWGQMDMSATVTGSMQTAVNWSVTGAGSITPAGVYSAPTAMPASRSVTIQAALASNPAITSSYALTIINPSPAISAASPTAVAAGTTTAVTLTGTGFVPSTVIQVNGVVVPSTYVTQHSIVAQITPGANATGNLQVQASTSTFTGGVSDFFDVAVLTPTSATAAARLLDQTTFGPTTALIQHVQQEGVTAWLAEQYATPQTVLPVVPATLPSVCPNDAEQCTESEWWQTVLTGNDQLRQRVAFALSELFVISQDSMPGWEVQYYANLLATDAFSNWYTIMNDVTLSPAMGVYLNMFNSAKPTGTLIANENFARENMQLFNLGLDLINQDGTLQLDGNGNPIPAYTEAQVEAFSRAFTGWTSANPDGSTPTTLIGLNNFYHQMVAVESQHDENPKTLLNGTTLPAGQTAEEDLAGAMTNVFEHPNLPPFVCKQLIQHLVKSNPSPEYVSRVAAVFINDGANVRGDMQAVLTAIFTDPEARAGDTAQQASDGHLREPILYLTGVMRGLGYVNVDPNNYYWYLSNRTDVLGEIPYESPAVFNFFPIGYVIPGTTLSGPEFGLENTGSVADGLTLANKLVTNDIIGFNVDLSATSPLGQILASQGPAALVNALSGLFLYQTMDPNTSLAITNEITPMSNNPDAQLRVAAYLTITSSEYKILH